MKKKIQEIIGLRCVAVTMVVLGHAQQLVHGGYTGWLFPLKFFSNGGQGVLIFFVLSGFLITGLLQREYRNKNKINLVNFYISRSLRIWPAFYFYIMTILILSQFSLLNVHWLQTTFAALHIWNYSALFDIGPTNDAHVDGTWYLGHLWSLALEEQFYWFWPPILIFLLNKKNDNILLAMILAIPVIRVVTYFVLPEFRGQLTMMLHTGVDPILVGCYVALKHQKILYFINSWKYSSMTITFGIIFLFFITPIIASTNYGGYWSNTFGRTIEASIVGLVIIIIIEKENYWLSFILRTKIFVFIGTISFSLYLWQQFFNGIGAPGVWQFPFNILQTLIAATISYLLIETPFLRFKNNFERKRISDPFKNLV